MKIRTLIFVFVAGAFLVLGWWIRRPAPIAPDTAPAGTVGTPATTASVPPQPSLSELPSSTKPSDPQARLQSALQELTAAADPEAARRLLTGLRDWLASLPPEVAAGVIRQFLDAKGDTPTRLDFKINADGSLSEAPSLRVFLLDQLGQLNRPAAMAYARTILSSLDSPNEWAVSLRDYARASETPQDAEFLKTKTRELINHPAWQQNPATGWLEAFDVAVHARATTLTPDLARLLMKHEPADKAAAHAAYLTLDRLVLAEPVTMLRQLQAQPELMAGREVTRANYFARADVRNADQRASLETYLLDLRRTPEELRTFAGLYPNANLMISHNLLTKVETPAQSELVARDRAALATLEQWQADPRFAPRKAELAAIHTRLAEFVRQAEGR